MRKIMTTALSEFRQVGITNALRRCQLFAGLPSDDLSAIASMTVVRSLDKGEYLFRQTDSPHGFYIVQTGAINMHRVNASGREQVIHVFRAGESMAEETVATETGYAADARAAESSQVLHVQKAGFSAFLKRHPELAFKLVSAMAHHVRMLIAQFDDLTLKDVETRLANWLVKRCPDPAGTRPVTIHLTTTKRMLAAEIGTVSETLSRTLAKFRKRRLIAVTGKTFTVLNPARLEAIVHETVA
jgi:CRP/FNR family transcriptional regulator